MAALGKHLRKARPRLRPRRLEELYCNPFKVPYPASNIEDLSILQRFGLSFDHSRLAHKCHKAHASKLDPHTCLIMPKLTLPLGRFIVAYFSIHGL
jgi:hypothetical protein